jgi:hypothetical protein
MSDGRGLLQRLLEVTPLPAAGTRVEDLLTAFEAVIAERAAILLTIVPPITLSEMDRPLLIELERRQNIWQDALAAALRRVGEQRVATTRLRAYAGTG